MFCFQEGLVHLNSLSLIRSCTQKAVSLLRDTGKKTSRSMERINILLVLLGDDPVRTGGGLVWLCLLTTQFTLLNVWLIKV